MGRGKGGFKISAAVSLRLRSSNITVCMQHFEDFLDVFFSFYGAPSEAHAAMSPHFFCHFLANNKGGKDGI